MVTGTDFRHRRPVAAGSESAFAFTIKKKSEPPAHLVGLIGIQVLIEAHARFQFCTPALFLDGAGSAGSPLRRQCQLPLAYPRVARLQRRIGGVLFFLFRRHVWHHTLLAQGRWGCAHFFAVAAIFHLHALWELARLGLHVHLHTALTFNVCSGQAPEFRPKKRPRSPPPGRPYIQTASAVTTEPPRPLRVGPRHMVVFRRTLAGKGDLPAP